jgi:hypothetical protein
MFAAWPPPKEDGDAEAPCTVGGTLVLEEEEALNESSNLLILQ